MSDTTTTTTNATADKIPADLAPLAQQAAQIQADLDSAVDAEQEAETEVLRRVLDLIRPAFRAMQERVVETYGDTSGRNGCHPVTETTHYQDRYVVLIDNYFTRKDETGNEGDYRGSLLCLAKDGSLCQIKRKGSWSCWQGAWSRYSTTLVQISERDAMRKYDLNAILDTVRDKLTAVVTGEGPKVTKRSLERAAKLRALADLLR